MNENRGATVDPACSRRFAARWRIGFVALALLAAAPLGLSGARANEASAPSAAVARDPRFGINETSGLGEFADRAGANWSRATFWWSQLQKHGPDEFDLNATEHDAHINDEAGRGRELVGLVLNTPGWVSSDGSANGVPKNLHLPWDHPDNHWGRFMRRMAEHYRGRVDTWIIWNEIDISSGQWNTWNGTLEDYVQLLKVAYRAVKAGNPNAKVLPFGAAWWYDRGATISRMLDLLAADPEARSDNFFFDVANLHLYSRAADIPQIVGWYRDQLARRGLERPIWVAETNAIPWDDPAAPGSKVNFRATQDEQASYMIQAFASYVGIGVQRVSVNRAEDGPGVSQGGEPFGLLRQDGSARPAFTAYQVVTRYFANVGEATYMPTDATGLTRVIMTRDDERITVAWTMEPQPLLLTLQANSPRALLLNRYGEHEVLEAQDGKYRVALPAATANSNEHDRTDYVIGGSPVILIERRDGNAMASFRPLDIAPLARGR